MNGHAAGAPVTYSQGEPVALDQVENMLAALWSRAGEESPDGEAGGLTRACLWNLVISPPPQSGAAEQDALERMLAEVGPVVPARVIHLDTRPEKEKPAGSGDVGCWVTTRCHPTPGGGRQVSSEEIRLVSYGAGGAHHFPALVRALLVPDLPVALIWLGSLPRKGRLLGQLLPLSDRILADTQAAGDADALTEMDGLIEENQACFIDLGWMRLNPVRYLLAGLFDPPGQAKLLRRVENLRVVATPRGRNTGLLMLGWLLSRLGAPAVKLGETGGEPGQWRWNARLDGGGYAVDYTQREGAGGRDGLLAVEIRAGGELFALVQVDDLHVALDSPRRKEQRLALHGWSDAELLVAGLAGPRTDPLYAGALHGAARLVAAQAWNR